MREQPHGTLPIIGYFHYDTVALKRKRKLMPRPHPIRGYNEPVRRIYQRKLASITPRKWSQDPYLVSILLAMAQSVVLKPRSPQSDIIVVRSRTSPRDFSKMGPLINSLRHVYSLQPSRTWYLSTSLKLKSHRNYLKSSIHRH